MVDEVAPSCPLSDSQIPYRHRLLRAGDLRGAPPVIGAIPPATDLSSLLRTVNLITDALRTMTRTLAVNNTLNPRNPTVSKKGDTFYSAYPQWEQDWVDTREGEVYHKERKAGVIKSDKSQKVICSRIDLVKFHNRSQADPEFKWSYTKKFDSDTQLPDL